MKKLLILLILSFFSSQGLSASCPDGNEPIKTVSADGSYYVYNCGNTNNEQTSSTVNDSNDVLNAPKAEFYQRQYDMNSKVDKKLSLRRTINPFLPYNWKIRESSKKNGYGLYFSGGYNFKNSWDAIQLKELYWVYYYPGQWWSYWTNTNQKRFLTDIKFDHDNEYGKTRKQDISNPEFAIEASKEVEITKNAGFNGIFLDWWHSNHPGINDKVGFTKNRKRILQKIYEKNGDDFLLMGNVNWETDLMYEYLNAVFLELYKPPDGRTGSYTFEEIEKIEKLILTLNENLRYPKVIAVQPWKVTNERTLLDRESQINKQLARLFSAMSAVLAEHGYIIYTDNNRDSDIDDHGHYYYDVYSVDLGKPLSKHTPIAQGVAYKKFEKGYIAFNRLEYDVTVNFGDFEVVIPSMDAVFMNEDGSNIL